MRVGGGLGMCTGYGVHCATAIYSRLYCNPLCFIRGPTKCAQLYAVEYSTRYRLRESHWQVLKAARVNKIATGWVTYPLSFQKIVHPEKESRCVSQSRVDLDYTAAVYCTEFVSVKK